MSDFVRKGDYSEEMIADVKKLVNAAKKIHQPILAIPAEDCIICYRGGMPFVTIYENRWVRFSDAYMKYFKSEPNIIDYREYLLDPSPSGKWEHLSCVLSA
ncbi:MAG: hypothetical protein IK078_00840, partial [Lachnospiraceae bacterium]|nr:hypothetical protein [Lachnospiraceae bacterium]